MKTGVFAGSFDPFTIGHMHVAKIASYILDHVVIVFADNPKKSNRRYDKNMMKEATEKALKSAGINNVTVVFSQELTVNVARRYNAVTLIRGLRDGEDFVNEERDATVNKEVLGMDTIYVRADRETGFISSSYVYGLFKAGIDISKYVPKEILDIMQTCK